MAEPQASGYFLWCYEKHGNQLVLKTIAFENFCDHYKNAQDIEIACIVLGMRGNLPETLPELMQLIKIIRQASNGQ